MDGWRYQRRGWRRVARSRERVRKFTCRTCGRWFSSSTFTDEYWTKKSGLTDLLFHMLNGGEALRQIARTLQISPTAVRHRQRRLARQSLLIHAEMLARLRGRIDEPIVLDGLRTFAGSQYEPLDLNTAILAKSGFLIDLDAAPLRRSGTMTARQRRTRERRDTRLGKPDPRARLHATLAALARLEPLMRRGRPLVLRTDEEQDYGRAVRCITGITIDHSTTSSRRRRDYRNPLWRVNHLHRLMRHSLANQKRETLSFSKQLRGLIDRALTYLVWHNCAKGLSERTTQSAAVTPAMRLGLESRRLRGAELFRRRRFPGRIGLLDSLRAMLDGTLRARRGESLAVPELKFAG